MRKKGEAVRVRGYKGDAFDDNRIVLSIYDKQMIQEMKDFLKNEVDAYIRSQHYEVAEDILHVINSLSAETEEAFSENPSDADGEKRIADDLPTL